MSSRRVAVGLGVVALLTLVGSVWADIRLSIPEDISPSAYTSLAGPSPFLPGVIQDGEWAAIPFYRPPECVPFDFNLMDWYDGSLAALDCPFLLEGFGVWAGDEPVGLPMTTQLRPAHEPDRHRAQAAELREAMADGHLSILELAWLPSLRVGTATSYEEQLHYNPPHPTGHSTIRARGTLAGGGSFSLLAVETDLEWTDVRIVLK